MKKQQTFSEYKALVFECMKKAERKYLDIPFRWGAYNIDIAGHKANGLSPTESAIEIEKHAHKPHPLGRDFDFKP